MVKLIIEIKEEKSKDIGYIKLTHCKIHIKELGLKETESEKEISNELKERIKVNEELQIVDRTTKISKEDILKDLLK